MITCNDFLATTRPDLFCRVKGVIFDCDGVLIDSREANAGFYNIFRSRYGLPPINEDEKTYVHGATVDDSLAHVLPPQHMPDAQEFRKTLDYRDVLPHLSLEPGLRELLLQLRDCGRKMAICTNRITTMNMLLGHFGLTAFFNPVVQARNVSLAKPHPEGVNAVLNKWGLPKDEVVFIGDSAFDQAAADGAGVPFWAYKNPSLTAVLHLPDFASLRRCMARCKA